MRWARLAAHMGEEEKACRILVGRRKRKRPPGRPRRMWEDIIKMNLREMGWCGMGWIHLAEDRDQ
jgi:hypothetical protein